MALNPLPRRAVLAGLAVSPAAFAVAGATSVALAAPALPAAISTRNDVDQLWHDYLIARGILTAVSAEEDAATARLPWWARRGPSYIDHHGRHVGALSWHPAIQEMQPSANEGALRCIRPSGYSIRHDYEVRAPFSGEGARRAFEKRMADLEDRLAAQESERARVGLPEITERSEAACEVLIHHAHAIRDLPQKSPSAAAARILITLMLECQVAATVESHTEVAVASIALDGLIPSLTGELARDASELIDNPSRPLSDMRILRGIAA